MAVVECTSHLKTHFPVLGGAPISLPVATVAEALTELDRRAPGIGFYISDELGRLRRHVNIFVHGEMIVDRQGLSDRMSEGTRLFITQALSGG